MGELWRVGVIGRGFNIKAEVGMFFVRRKDGLLRLFVDTRVPKRFFKDPRYNAWPSGEALSEIETEAIGPISMDPGDV